MTSSSSITALQLKLALKIAVEAATNAELLAGYPVLTNSIVVSGK